MIKALIIDDEQKARNILHHFITHFIPEIHQVEQADSVDVAMEILKNFQPDIVFLDVEMPHKNGFDFLIQVKDSAFDVIFTTAYNQYAIQAIRFSALDYLLKPIDSDDLTAAVQRHLEKRETAQQKKTLYSNLVQNIGKKEVKDFKIAVPSTEGVHFFMVDDIVRLEAAGSYTNIYLINAGSFMASKTLKHFEEMLEEFHFIRTHKSHLVNPKFITRLSSDHEFLVLSDGSKVEISRRKKEEVQQQLNLR